MKILITGSSGQLGRELLNQFSNYEDVNNHKIIAPTRQELNLEDEKDCEKFILDNSPDLIINLAAYTAVENAEKNIEEAFKINSLAPKAFAKAIKSKGGHIIQISSDYVFDGAQNKPYKENQKRNPISYYGYTKALGEELIAKNINNLEKATILRTSWLMGAKGTNFAIKILKLLLTNTH